MHCDFSLFRERLAEACRARNTTETNVSAGIGLGAKRAFYLTLAGPRAIDVYRLCQIADVLDVSLDWFTGRSNVMDVLEMPEPPKPKSPKKRGRIVSYCLNFIRWVTSTPPICSFSYVLKQKCCCGGH
jgi:hypothetical protein